MGFEKPSAQALQAANKMKRKELFGRHKKATGKERREERFRRRKEEQRDPALKTARLIKNKTVTLDQKRVWDEGNDDSLGARVDLEKLQRQRLEQAEAEEQSALEAEGKHRDKDDDDSMLGSDDDDSMLGSDDEDDDMSQACKDGYRRQQRIQRDSSIAPSTASTNLDLAPLSLALKFPSLFSDIPPADSKILVTTSLNATIHDQAQLISTLFPNSTYVPRSGHRYAYRYSLREICKFATKRNYTAVLLIKEDLKKPAGLSIVHLPSGPTCHFSITNYLEGKKLPGHGNPTNHYPELLLNNFKTPLGLLTAKLFQSLFPPKPEIQGRQVVTMHNQRDYIFVRRHRYVFRDRRSSEKCIVDSEGREMKGVENIRVGLQELGPQFTLKLRRVDKGIGRAGSEGEDATQWEWKAKMEKDRKRFNL
ncbi:hypothetical protein CDD82_1938 [Ophiocordyceps australis]|uniref:Brix domain-containing protein n=1 Tax=Ophiocordyceps australis TaxID=1399860 RepID=A0A2C5YPZ4_9HYPO|nr:hypothetical protein CDD82_1938 [Ophiocordyceps australis]